MPKISTPSYVKGILREKGYAIKKRFGQNFLVDQNYVDRIVAAADLSPTDWVLEIGPGLGVLTHEMAVQAGQVVALEIDRELAGILQETLEAPNVHIVECDALQVDWREVLQGRGWRGGAVKLVANLPYYITTPLIMKALESGLPFEALVVMVQREVADRMVADPGSKDYGVLSLAVQYYSQAEIVTRVPRSVFYPPPEVDSAVVKLVPRPPAVTAPQDELFQVIRAAFQQRRKTIRNSLKALADAWELSGDDLDAALHEAEIGAELRGERLSLNDFSRLTEALIKRC
ncbi:MAG: 16S rRNA (adenine(1518)-N(6)/adenine(1519)-N(6))-dimethyltransferase RsmA [Firmicutes bacterium]|nr:16S rRNA (adenine(1518)-N(6)/adenine(1519)-N(6))-dimethyltransferase RsmA [Bacillota bacterium]